MEGHANTQYHTLQIFTLPLIPLKPTQRTNFCLVLLISWGSLELLVICESFSMFSQDSFTGMLPTISFLIPLAIQDNYRKVSKSSMRLKWCIHKLWYHRCFVRLFNNYYLTWYIWYFLHFYGSCKTYVSKAEDHTIRSLADIQIWLQPIFYNVVIIFL